MKVTKTLVMYLLIALVAAQISICPIAFMAETSQEIGTLVPVFQKGMSYSSWTTEDFTTSNSDESLKLLTRTNTEWIAICFSWFQSNTTSYDIHPDPVATATTESVKYAITKAHNLGLKVMLKPMVDTLEEEKTQPYEHVWRGEILSTEEWFKSYSNFINSFAELAQENRVELFCVGCELKATTAAK